MPSCGDPISEMSDAVADCNTLLTDLEQAKWILSLDWRLNQATLPALGAYTGIMPVDYRFNPEFAVQQLQRSTAPVAKCHTFGQSPQPRP